MNNFEKDIEIIINTILESATTELMNDNADTIKQLEPIVNNKHFFDNLESAQYRFYTIVTEILNIPEQKNKYIIEHILSGLYEHFFYRLMQKTEGSACCADKARFIKSMTIKALKNNINLSLYEDYTEYEQIKEDKERQAYWSPITIKDTDTAMELFWHWYMIGD